MIDLRIAIVNSLLIKFNEASVYKCYGLQWFYYKSYDDGTQELIENIHLLKLKKREMNPDK